MRIVLIIVLILTANFAQSSEKDIFENFIRIEITNGGLHSIKFFNEGLLCKSVDYNFKVVMDFYPLKDLEYKKIIVIQEYLQAYQSYLYEMDLIQEDPLIKISSAHIGFLLISNYKLKRIEWHSGKNEYLKTIIKLMNDLIPRKTRKIYRIQPF